ncbi:hypothetical protein F5144DRAFT_639165 [Chaetomium tenue]|uniref:Uncharacterized protein n=1 Tax=Chaetomium tenue TaxID=1854479 RepID=A0ACB7PQ26_9PEZI|nr:hypothetical protein F5144DRAFT_639165 [Chaetomium globosum]
MAIITSLPGLSVTVEVEGEAAWEFRHPIRERDNSTRLEGENFDLPPNHEGPLPHVVRYIEGVPGEAFEVVIVKEASFQGRSHHLGYKLYMDGKETGKDQHYPGYPAGKWTSRISGFISGNPTSGYQEHRFRFKDLQLTTDTRGADENISDEDLRRQTLLVREYGRLIVEVYNMDESGWTDSFRTYDVTPELRDPKFSEQALEGSSLDCVVIETSHPIHPPQPEKYREWNHNDPANLPFAVFEFIYRTRHKQKVLRESVSLWNLLPPWTRLQGQENNQRFRHRSRTADEIEESSMAEDYVHREVGQLCSQPRLPRPEAKHSAHQNTLQNTYGTAGKWCVGWETDARRARGRRPY